MVMAGVQPLPVRSALMTPRRTPKPASPRPSGSLLFVLVISAVVMVVAVLVAVWMYWLSGVVPG
jgi:uncharacterized membrane protein